MKMTLVAAVLAAPAIAFAGGSHSVRPYVTKSGAIVAPHHATNPNGSKADNWSGKGNVNPYTGKAGTKDPYAVTAPSSRPLTGPRK